MAGAASIIGILLVCLVPASASAGVAAKLAVDVKPGPSGITGPGFNAADLMMPVGDQMFFAPGFTRYGRELWRTDGRTAQIVRDIAPGVDYGWRGGSSLTPYKGSFYFQAYSPGAGAELWRLTDDGSDAELVADIYPGPDGGYPRGFTPFDGYLYFVAGNESYGQEIWRYDGTDVERVTDINPGPGDSWAGFGPSTVLGEHLYFLANDGVVGTELWRTDGDNTELWFDATPGAEGSSFADFRVVANRLFFSTRTDYGLDPWTWSTDGETRTRIAPFEGRQFTEADGKVYFTSWNSTLFVSDPPGAPSQGVGSRRPEDVANLTVIDDDLYFTGELEDDDRQPWRITNGILQQLRPKNPDLNPGISFYGSGGSGPFAKFDDRIFLSMWDQRHGTELWTLDGKEAVLFKDILPGSDSSGPGMFTHFRGDLYFMADDGRHGYELWRLFEDDEVNIEVPGLSARVTKGVARVRLGCPSTEQAGPCLGTVTLKRGNRLVGRGSFRIGPGVTRRVKVKVRKAKPGPVTAKITVRDDAGNSRSVIQKMRLFR